MAPSVLLVHEAGRFPWRSRRSESWVPPSSSPSCTVVGMARSESLAQEAGRFPQRSPRSEW
eukprot:6355645-Heterocapsa_arctica.AAC.1